jgi:hypothetical protein
LSRSHSAVVGLAPVRPSSAAYVLAPALARERSRAVRLSPASGPIHRKPSSTESRTLPPVGLLAAPTPVCPLTAEPDVEVPALAFPDPDVAALPARNAHAPAAGLVIGAAPVVVRDLAALALEPLAVVVTASSPVHGVSVPRILITVTG